MTKTLNPELAEEVQYALSDLLASEEGRHLVDGPVVEGVNTFEDAGFLTRDKGLLVTLSDGSQVELTVVAYSPSTPA